MKKLKNLALLMGLLMMGTVAMAQINGTVAVSLTLQAGCTIFDGSNNPIPNGGSYGTMNFGTASTVFTGQLSAQTLNNVGSGPTVLCSSDVTSVNVTIDGGQNAGQGAAVGPGTRAMKNGTDYVPYEVYAAAARQVGDIYTAGTPKALAVSAGVSFTLPIYGLVNKTASGALGAGAYADTLAVTIAW